MAKKKAAAPPPKTQIVMADSEGPIDQIPEELAKARDEHNAKDAKLKVAVNTAKAEFKASEEKLKRLMKLHKVSRLVVQSLEGPKAITIEVSERIRMKRIRKEPKNMRMD